MAQPAVMLTTFAFSIEIQLSMQFKNDQWSISKIALAGHQLL